MGRFWQDNIIDAGKLPLLLCLVAFVVTFVITRVIVRMIRSGRGPFKDNSFGGVHVHHMVPGLVLLVLGGLVAIGSRQLGWVTFGAVLFGIGLALVLDEFALVLHLQDVYWEQEGRLSVDVVFVVMAIMVLVVLVGSPFGTDVDSSAASARIEVTIVLAVDIALVIIAAVKGKLITAMVGVFIPLIAIVGAIRLARPRSPWAHRRYADESTKLARATERDDRIERRWRSKIHRFRDLVAGSSPTESV